jgi:SAM-dependent methyltransferase
VFFSLFSSLLFTTRSRRIRASDEAFDYGSDQWDLIVFMYEPFPVASAAYVERLHKSMKPGGLIVLETFAPGPKGKWVATDPEQLLVAFKDFKLLYFEDTFAKPDWVAPQEKLHIVSMVVEKRP